MSKLLSELPDKYSETAGKYKLYFKTYPFKDLDIIPVHTDSRSLFSFTCFEGGGGRWLLSMYKTSYYTNPVYQTELYGENATVEKAIEWADSTLKQLYESLKKHFDE